MSPEDLRPVPAANMDLQGDKLSAEK
jgi:hypothetical protein